MANINRQIGALRASVARRERQLARAKSRDKRAQIAAALERSRERLQEAEAEDSLARQNAADTTPEPNGHAALDHREAAQRAVRGPVAPVLDPSQVEPDSAWRAQLIAATIRLDGAKEQYAEARREIETLLSQRYGSDL